MTELVNKIALELKLNPIHTQNVINLLFEEECTIPFVARYRKEATGSMDEVNLRSVRDRYEYLQDLETSKIRYLKVVEEHAKLKPEIQTKLPELRVKFMACQTKQELEDLYLPFKPKRRTRAIIAKEKGLEPLLEKILAESKTLKDLEAIALEFVTAEDAQLEDGARVKSVKEALQGAQDIFAERVHETPELRGLVRDMSFASGLLVASKADLADGTDKTDKDAEKRRALVAKYENYFEYQEPLAKALSHRIMAVRRGESEKVLRLRIDVDDEGITKALRTGALKPYPSTPVVAKFLEDAANDAYKRLMAPSIETEIRLELKTRAEAEAIQVFSKNLENLLLLPPIPGKVVLGVDPGLRTGSKLAVISETGKLLDHAVIYPSLSGNAESGQSKEAAQTLVKFLSKYKVGYIAIGNGTGSREIDQFIIRVMKEGGFTEVKRLVVNESGASVYSTDDIAREEFPDLDPTIRSAVSIARRLQDPLAELVKIDPRSIGVGQYQHDCNVTKLTQSLKETVESCVNRVGVNVNTASYKLLSYVSGIGPHLAKNIAQTRDQQGGFKTRLALKDVVGFGPKAFEQAAGFLRIPGGLNLLDNSAVHPERYDVVAHMAQDIGLSLADVIGRKENVGKIALEKYVNQEIGLPTLMDIAEELVKPGRDPREDGSRLHYSDDVTSMEDLNVGMKLKGTVTNVTNFGVFVDIGVHQDGLVHISELSDEFVKDPASVASVGDVVDVRVIAVDLLKHRISLSCRKKVDPAPMTPQRGAQAPASQRRDQEPRVQFDRQQAQRPERSRPHVGQQPRSHSSERRPVSQPSAKSYSVDDLLSKFNIRN